MAEAWNFGFREMRDCTICVAKWKRWSAAWLPHIQKASFRTTRLKWKHIKSCLHLAYLSLIPKVSGSPLSLINLNQKKEVPRTKHQKNQGVRESIILQRKLCIWFWENSWKSSSVGASHDLVFLQYTWAYQWLKLSVTYTRWAPL